MVNLGHISIHIVQHLAGDNRIEATEHARCDRALMRPFSSIESPSKMMRVIHRLVRATRRHL
jgi:hypothetical protein